MLRPGKRWIVNFLQLEKDEEDFRKVMLFIDRYFGYVFKIYLVK